MRHLLAAAAAAALTAAVLAPAGAGAAAGRPAGHCTAQPSPHCGHARTAPAARACNEQVAWDYHPGASPPFSEAKWTANSCGHSVRGVAHCQSGRSEETGLGGWVTSLNLWSKGVCQPGYSMIGAAYDTKNCGSCSFTRHWLYGHRKQ